jgi:hypothetical protein
LLCRNDRARACTRTFRSWWGLLVSDGCCHLQLMHAARAVRGAWLPWIYKSKGKEGESFTSKLRVCRPLLLASAPEHRAPFRFLLAFASSPRSFTDRNGSPAVDHRAGPTAVETLDGDEVRFE